MPFPADAPRSKTLYRFSRLGVAVGCSTLAICALACGSSAPQDISPSGGFDPDALLATCRIPGFDGKADCGSLEVYEDRSAQEGRKIGLRTVVLHPERPDEPSKAPIFYVAGGPGASVVDQAPFLARFLSEARRNRHLVLVDARGTGGSNPLFCPYQQEPRGLETALNTFIPTERVPECREALAERADLTQYSTTHIVDDLDQVRRALGLAEIHLVGASYGTRVVQVFLRRHPETVASAVLLGASPLDAYLPSRFARDAQRALDALFEECATDPACRKNFPDPAADLAAAVERLDSNPSDGPQSFPLTPAAFHQTVRYMLYRAGTALDIPSHLRAAAEGHFEPIAQRARAQAGGLLQSLPDGLYLSITCSEDVAFINHGAAKASAQGTFLGNFRVEQQTAACEDWPRFELEPNFHRAVQSSMPALLISGERDPVTPAADAETIARGLSNSRHLIIPDGAHASFALHGTQCIPELIAELMDRQSPSDLDIESCRNQISRPAFSRPIP